MNTLPFSLERSITIEAKRETVFNFFTSSALWARWWGAGSTIDAKVGGRVFIRHPNNVEVSGEVVALTPPSEIVFTYGYASGKPFGPGESRVTVRLADIDVGTRLILTHDFPDAEARAHHEQGWRYQLSLFGNAVANTLHADAAQKADAWFDLWANPDAATRARELSNIASDTVQFRDRYSLNDGQADLLAHITATQRFMPGIRLTRAGDVRHCQGTVLADWTAAGPDGNTLMKGVNVFVLDCDGKIARVTGLLTP